MTQGIDQISRGADDASRETGSGYAGARVRALAESSARGRRDDDPTSRRPGVRTHVGRWYGHDHSTSAAPRAAGWFGDGVQLLRNRPLRGIGAATATAVIVGLIVFTLLNRRQ